MKSKNELTVEINAVLAELTSEIKKQNLEIPSPPDLLLQLRSLVNDERSTANDIAELVKLDPNISIRLIKVANSALLGARVHVTSAQAAVTRLGSAKVQNLVTGLVIAQNFMKGKTRGLESYFNGIWQQSNNVAAIAYVLAQKKTKLDPEEALLAGMIHNIGVTPLILKLSSSSSFKANPSLLKKVADIVIPKLYQSAGKLILDNWKFSSTLSQITLTHNKFDRSSPGDFNLNDLILIASELNKLEDMTDVNGIPEILVETEIFKKLWADWPEAISDLEGLKPDIAQMKSAIAN